MIASQNSIFRDKALKHYTQNKKKDILPNFSSIPVAIFLWMLLGSLIATGLVAWHAQVPVYLTGASVVLGTGKQETVALAFLAPNTSTQLHAGLAVHIQIGATGSQLASTIVTVEPGTTTLANAFEHAGLPVGNASEMKQPVTIILINRSPSAVLDRGSIVVVQVTLGTHSLFSAISGIGN